MPTHMILRRESVIALILLAVPFQMIFAQRPTGRNPDILQELAPDGSVPAQLNLSNEKKVRAIGALLAIQGSSDQKQRQEIAYLLATLGHEYGRNRNVLLGVWKGCAGEVATDGCDDLTGEYLMKLYLQGLKELLRPLVAAHPVENAALQEGLGSFMGDRLSAQTPEFLTIISGFPVKDQRRICSVAAQEDGGGMPPKDYDRAIRNLKRIGGDVAGRCEREVRLVRRDSK